MTLIFILVFLVAENAFDASAALSSGNAQKKTHTETPQCGFTAVVDR